ncbi:hypothetical protein AMTRI_Chr11g152670 [Amborella trichopoda]
MPLHANGKSLYGGNNQGMITLLWFFLYGLTFSVSQRTFAFHSNPKEPNMTPKRVMIFKSNYRLVICCNPALVPALPVDTVKMSLSQWEKSNGQGKLTSTHHRWRQTRNT